MKNLLHSTFALAVLPHIVHSQPCAPSQIHVSPGTPADSSMWISWTSQEECIAVVELQGGSSGLRVIPGSAGAQYTTETLKYGTYVSDFQNHLLLSDLEPSTTYRYRCGGEHQAFSSWREFRTLPQRGALDHPVRIAVVGDVGQTSDSIATMRAANLSSLTDYSALGELIDPSFLMVVGDLSYADENGSRWDTWAHKMEPWLSGALPIVAMPGNHEIEYDTLTSQAFPHWRARFRMPETAPEESAPGYIIDYHTYNFKFHYEYGSSYFSFDSGPVHHICLNTYADTSQGSTQYLWLEADLKRAEQSREEVPWIIVYAHGPWYNSNRLHRNEVATMTMRESMEPLLHAHKVAAFFAGHVHAYERTHPAYLGKRADEDGTVYVTIGDGGNREGLYDSWTDDDDVGAGGEGGWVAFRNGSHYGRGDLLIPNGTHMRWQWWPTGEEVQLMAEDETWIINPFVASGNNQRRYKGGATLAIVITSVFMLLALTGLAFGQWRKRNLLYSAAALTAQEETDAPFGAGAQADKREDQEAVSPPMVRGWGWGNSDRKTAAKQSWRPPSALNRNCDSDGVAMASIIHPPTLNPLGNSSGGSDVEFSDGTEGMEY